MALASGGVTDDEGPDRRADIIEARTARGWTQQQLADQAGIDRGTVGRAERGGDIGAESLRKIEQALGLAASETLDDIRARRAAVERERQIRRWSRQKLAEEAGVSMSTVARTEDITRFPDVHPRVLRRLELTLGLGEFTAMSDDEVLRRVPADALAAEFARRIHAAQEILNHAKVRTGTVDPRDAADQDTVRGPRFRDDPDGDAKADEQARPGG